MLLTKAVAHAWQVTLEKIATTRPEAVGKLGYIWGQGEVDSLRSIPNYTFHLEEHFDDISVTSADGANDPSDLD